MAILIIISGMLLAYLLGSFPTAVWIGKAQYGIDVRDYGSGNAGATNTFRVLGKKAGIVVMAVDVFKGFTATAIAAFLTYFELVNLTENQFVFCQILFGFAAVLGHIFPIYAGFRGGKGIATLLGMILAVSPEAALGCVAIFLIVFLTSKYVSLGSMVASLAFPIILLVPRFNLDAPPVLIAFGFVIFSLVVLTHRKNINRLIAGEENKANIRLRKNQ